jgi:localization factor PodJL
MTSAAPWSVKGIDPKTREIAKDLARRSGMTLGEWLTHVIAEDNDDGGEFGGDAIPGGGARKAGDRPASENRSPRRGGDDLSRVLEALEDLSARFEASVQEQAETTVRFNSAIADLQADQAKVAARLQAAEHGGGPAAAGKIETLKALEGALNKVAGHLAAGEGRQLEAMAVMRREIGEEMSRVADEVNRKMLEAENRGADAIFQVGAEVTRVAATVEQRLRRADDSQAEALEKLGGEIARITERLSDRIAAAESRSAQSVEDVGQQVARIADRIHARQARSESELADRIRQSEERTAKLLEEARQTIDRRLLRAGAPEAPETPISNAFIDRWTPAQSPEAEAHAAHFETLETEAAQVEAPEVEAAAEPALEPEHIEPAPFAAEAETVEETGLAAESIVETSDQGLTAEGEAEDEPYADHDEDDHPEMRVSYEAHVPSLVADGFFHSGREFEAMQAVADAITSESHEEHHLTDEDDGAHEEDDEEDHETAEEPVAWDAAAAFDRAADTEESLRPSMHEAAMRADTAAYADDEAEDDAHGAMTFADLGARRHRSNHAMRGALLAGGAAAFMGLAGAGYVALHPEMTRGFITPAAHPIPVGPPSAPAPATAPQAAVALATAPTPAASRTGGQDLESLYRDAAVKVDHGDASGVATLRTVANLGYAPAQRSLGVLYEKGGAGVEKDPVEGRRWTVRAAANGDARGMHNLALDYYQGVGGAQNATVAAEWFQRAAELGVLDSQYNLARFFEAGIGVQRDLAAAYRWYLIAGRAGDTASVARADSLKDKLTVEERTHAEAIAAAFRPDPAAAPASLATLLKASNPKQLALAQRALAKLGYYSGTDDGMASEALGEAIQSYQRERGLAANGQLSPELLQTFAHIAQ